MRRALLAVLAVVGAYVLITALIHAIPDLNPFGSKTIDRSQPAVLKSIQRLDQYRAATANLQVIVDVEQDANLLPDFLKGERTLFVAAGTVDAGVDLGRARVQVDDDGTGATITLPHARLYEAHVDPDRSRVVDRQRGLLDRLEGAFEDSPTSEHDLLVLSQRKLTDAARADPQLLRTAERNTRQMLENLLRGLGFRRVTVRFEGASV